MPEFPVLIANLRQLDSEILRKLPAALLGRPNNDAEADRMAEDLDRLQTRLSLLIRDLKSYENLLIQQQRASSRGSGNAWAARQRLQNVQDLKKEAEALVLRIDEMMRRSGMNAMQFAGRASEQFGEVQVSLSEMSEAVKAWQKMRTTSSIAAAPGPEGAHAQPLGIAETGVPLLTFAALILRSTVRWLKGRK